MGCTAGLLSFSRSYAHWSDILSASIIYARATVAERDTPALLNLLEHRERMTADILNRHRKLII